MSGPVPIFSWRSALGSLAGLAASSPAFAADVEGGDDPFLQAVQWMEDSLLGTVATTLAVMAVGLAFLLILSGHLNWRRGVALIIGSCLLFTATTLVAGISSY